MDQGLTLEQKRTIFDSWWTVGALAVVTAGVFAWWYKAEQEEEKKSVSKRERAF